MAAPVHDNLEDSNGSIDDYSLVKKRTNVLLLGDHIGDLGMSDGLNYENRIAVGFLLVNSSLPCFIQSRNVIAICRMTFIILLNSTKLIIVFLCTVQFANSLILWARFLIVVKCQVDSPRDKEHYPGITINPKLIVSGVA